MNKKIYLFIICFMCLCGLLGCGKNETSSSYVTVEINPGVEFVVDENNKVISVNGLNDDGKTLIVDVDFKGMKLDAALDIVIDEAQNTGFLVEASANTDDVSKEISISVTAKTEAIKEDIETKVEKRVNEIIEETNVAATYKKLEEKGRDYLEQIALSYDPALTQEELDALTYEELMNYVELATIEKAQFASVALEEYYIAFKEQQFTIKHKEKIAEALGTTNAAVAVMYNMALNGLKSAIEVIDKIQYSVYVSEDSGYLKLLAKLNEYKEQNLVLQVQLGSAENSAEIKAEIALNQQKIAELEASIVEFMNSINEQLETAKAAIESAIVVLEEQEKKITSLDFNQILTDVETSINEGKDSLLSQFEQEFADDIAAAKQAVSDRKTRLEENLKAK